MTTPQQFCAVLGLMSIVLVSLGFALREGLWLLARVPRVTTWGLTVLAFLMAGGAPLDIKAALTPGATFAQDTLRFVRSRSMVGLLAILAAASAYMHIHEHSLFAQVMPFLMAGIIGGLIGLLYLAARLVDGIDPIEPITHLVRLVPLAPRVRVPRLTLDVLLQPPRTHLLVAA